MRLRLGAMAAVVAVSGLAGGGPASAATIAPPGNSGVDEYVEVIPTLGGGQATPPGGTGSHTPAASALTRRAARALDRTGADGKALASVVETSAPAGAREAQRRGRRRIDQPGSPAAGTPAAGTPSAPASALSALGVGSDIGGMGLLLPVLLLGSAAGIGALVWRRRRTPAP